MTDRVLLFVASLIYASGIAAADELTPFLKAHCFDCHSGDTTEAGLNLETLSTNLQQPELFAKWERVFDRIAAAEMPPSSATQPAPEHQTEFQAALGKQLSAAHAASKGTVLRRLNRSEYENTLNDIFGTELNLASMLPEDGRSHEFDNVGSSLGVSMVHLQLYMDAVGKAFETAIAKTAEEPPSQQIVATYKGSREAEQFVGKTWKELPDGAIVRFSGGGYPSGMMRGTSIEQRGRYKVRVTGYAYQSQTPITFFVGGTSFAPGSDKPIYGFFSFEPDKPGAIEFEAVIDQRFMIQIEPYGINDPDRYKRQGVDDYRGPGLAILNVTMDGPLSQQFPSKGHRLVFDGIDRQVIPPRNPNDAKNSWYKPVFDVVSENESADARQSLLRVATAAFRRPVQHDDVSRYVTLFEQERSDGATFEDSLRTAVTAVFCSPRFLYLQEQPGRLDDFQLAARLSYFLTRTCPDERLFALATANQLASDQQTLHEQTERLLNDVRFERCIANLCDSWLDLRELEFTTPDSKLFPEFDDYLRYSMPEETRAYVMELFRSNLPVDQLVKSDFAMLNSRLAELYDLPAVPGAEIRKVSLPAENVRGGLLTQASILKVTANGTNTSPVKRGAWVMERILGEVPQPPPPGIPGVEPDIRGAATLRELLEKHRNVDSCNACHRKIDPPGFALESFNPIGGFRERYRSIGSGDKVDRLIEGRKVQYKLGLNVDCSGQLPDGRSFANYAEFRDRLAAQPSVLAKTVVTKLLTFATGREPGFSDRTEIDQIVEASAADGYGMRNLLHLVVQSEIFRTK